MRIHQFIGLALSGLFLFWGCSNSAPKSLPVNEPQQVIIVLDLSDRILKSGQIEKDKEIINSILLLFEQNQKKQIYIASKDMLQVVIAKEPGVDIEASDLLRIDMSKKSDPKFSGKIGISLFKERKAAFLGAIDELYAKAQRNPNPGADIYSFFCTDLATKYLADETKVIVITDGYLLFDQPFLKGRPKGSYMREIESLRNKKASWKSYFESRELALQPCSRNINGVQVLMLETAPNYQGASVFEFDFVEHYWMEWFNAMGVVAFIYPHEQKIGVIEGRIQEFLKK